jgi:hypothetical protein
LKEEEIVENSRSRLESWSNPAELHGLVSYLREMLEGCVELYIRLYGGLPINAGQNPE